jgi:PAS domain S-box-containing protein
MISVPGYSNLQIIHQSARTLVYTATRIRNTEKVVLRQLRPESTTPELVARYRKEYEILQSIDSDFVIKVHDLIDHNGCPILVTENTMGEPLIDLIDRQDLDLEQATGIVRSVAIALDDIHSEYIVHKNINPSNIIYNPETRSLRIIDFSISSALSSASLKTEATNTLEGTLAYMAPEQTGRMNRSVDYRADFYSLGATMYHLFTGQPPFTGTDPLELVHSHIAKNPQPPEEKNHFIPLALSRITTKLLSKMPEDRYQSAFAIRQDLTRCLEQMDEDALDVTEVDFEVALDDIAEQLNISERLLEREEALKTLRLALASAADGSTEAIICTGEAGVGKSSLIRELEKDVYDRGGFVASGRHDPTNSATPYAAVSSAFSDLIKQLLSRQDFPQTRERIRKALAGYEMLMLNLIPGLSLIIDAGEDEHRLSPGETRNRLFRGLANLVKAICARGQPLVLYLDNIQWVDHASIELFEPLFSHSRVPYVFLLGAYRTGELPPGNETRMAVSKLADSNSTLQLVRLENISVNSIASMISVSFFRSVEETMKLAEIVFSKTNGNPLAVREFLLSLHHKGYLSFSRQHREWQWDLDKINNEPPSENVSMVLADRMQNLEPATAALLKVASCIGNEFDLDTLQVVSGLSLLETSTRLSQAVKEGYLLSQSTNLYRQDRKIFYQFAHERIQQTAYSLLTNKERRKIHRDTGQALLPTLDHGPDIFNVVNQLNNSFESPEDTGINRNKLAELNQTAGQQARQSAAFQSSFKYFKTAIALYGQNIWVHYELSFDLHLEAAESAYLCGDSGQLRLLIKTSLEHARSPLDTARIHEIELKSLVASDDLKGAIEVGHKALGILGIKVPARIRLNGITLLIRLLWQTLRMGGQVTTNIEPMRDELLLAAMRILMILCQAGYMSGSGGPPLYILMMTRLSLKHGMAPESSFAFPMFGALLITYLGVIDSGYRFGTLALENLDESNHELHCKTLTLVNNFILIWKHHLRNSLEPLSQAYRIGMETGDIEFSLIAAITGSANAFILGHDLNSLETALAINNKKASEFNQGPILRLGSIYQQAVSNLTTPNNAPWLLEGEIYSENQLIQFHQESGDRSSIANLYMIKLFLALLFHRPEHALEFAMEARQVINSVISSPAVPFFIIYESLACIASLGRVSYSRRFRLRARLKLNQRLLRKWCRHAPENVLHGYHLVEAEKAKYQGRVTTAMDHYDLAIESAVKYGFLKEQAFANEMAGRFYLESGKHDLGMFYLSRAKTNYRRWGATNKVRWMNDEFAELDERDQFGQARADLTLPSGFQEFADDGYRTYGNFLDLSSVIKASQVLAGEIVLESLLEKLMQVSLENAGAHSSSLILSRDDQFIVEITTWYNGSSVEHRLDGIPIEEAEHLPVSVIQYVARTQEDLVLNDALNEDIFTQDDYIITRQPKSILCIPIQSKSHLTGVLYLENLHASHAFTQDRVAILKLLASQSAIAIENAKLYQQLNDSRNKYLSLYRNAIEGFYEIDRYGLLTNINPAAAELMGFNTPEEILKIDRTSTSELFVDPEDFRMLQNELSTNGRVIGFETRIIRKDKSVLWVSLSAQLVYVEEKAETHLEGSVIDISERRLREEAEQARIVAEAETETKSQFLANMSHEIRTPMNAIIGYTDLALDTTLTSRQYDYLKTIRNSSHHLLRVINDILDISKVESGKLELQKSVFSLPPLFDDLRNLFSLAAEEKRLDLILPDERQFADTSYIGDQVRIGQVLINLLGNALKFTFKGEVRVELEALEHKDGRTSFNFTVTDTGIGIDESHLETIFESFNQGTVTDSSTGTGLGLSICRKLVEMMDGHIYATSKQGQGSKFYFSVFVEPWDESPISVIEADVQVNLSASLTGKSILLVEDNAISQDLAREVLINAGFDVTLASHGAEAIAKLETDSFFAVLMDIRMPVMDGLQAIKLIRADENLKNTRVIALSAGVLQAEVSEAMEAGFDHYLGKPVDFDKLLGLFNVIAGVGQEEESSPLPRQEIRGIDFGQALRNHDHDLELLDRLTGTFIDIYQHSDEELKALIRSRDLDKAERLMHNIAGVAGSFGATGLMNVARDIEHSLQDATCEITALETVFSDELSNLVRAIEQLHSELVA